MKKRFFAIEGLRAWLAWAVVLDHCVYFSTPFLSVLIRGVGFQAVVTFVIISGFVVAHLLLERPESYGAYLTRRFFRLAPLFAVMSVAGYYAYIVQVRILPYGFGNQDLAVLLRNIESSQSVFFWQHLLAHLTMLSSAINNETLPYADYAFSMPAWSVSLEWQFYLVAPCLLYPLLRHRSLLPLAAALVVLGAWLFNRGRFGHYDQPGLLFALGPYFAVGIASRLYLPRLKLQNPHVALALCLLLLVLGAQPALAVWAFVYLGLGGTFGPLYRLAFESRPALYFGSRSYAIYLSHFPTIVACQWLWIQGFGVPPNLVALLVTAVPVTIAVSEILHRSVERPGIRLGARLASDISPVVALERVRRP
jgi:peptidoglycan/LPS O-acetylase OafA/YrhL